MQDHDNSSNKNTNGRRSSGNGGSQKARSSGQPKPTGAPRSGSQPRRQVPDGQSRANNQARPNRQVPSDQPNKVRQQKPAGQPRRQAPDERSRVNSQSRPVEAPGQSKARRQTPSSQSKPTGQSRSNARVQSNGRPQNMANNKARKNPKNMAPHQAAKKKRGKILLFIAEIFILLILVAVLWTVKKAQTIQYVEIEPEKIYIDEEVQAKKEEGTSSMKGYRNIALFGVDSRTKQLSNSTRTDVIMIASVNQDTKEVRLISVYRDTWLNMSNDSYSKANAAYARGGAEQAINMLNMNLDLDITDFVTVGFDAVIDVVDEIGGVEINVTEEEIVHLNSYQISMVGKVVGKNAAGEDEFYAVPYVEYTPVEHAGLQTLNGLQATAYSRIRYVGGDGMRTQRQRTLLTQIAKKAMTMNPATINKIVDSVFGEIKTSLKMSEILELLSDIASYEIGETAGFPFADHVQMAGRVGKASVVVPIDLTKNVALLHEFLFDDSDYTPSATVNRCSQKIASDTGISYNGE